jgi:TPR repeat protein
MACFAACQTPSLGIASQPNEAMRMPNVSLAFSISMDPAAIGAHNAKRWMLAGLSRNPKVARENADLLFPNGLEVERDIHTAIYWLNKAAESGKAEALAALGDLFREGRGGKRDCQEAHRLYLRAAEQGVVSALNALGDLYDQGLGVQRDPEMAATWYERARRIGSPQGDAAPPR